VPHQLLLLVVVWSETGMLVTWLAGARCLATRLHPAA